MRSRLAALPSAKLSRPVEALLASLAIALTAAAPATATTDGDLPAEAPPAAHRAEPPLPEPSEEAWPFPESFPRTSGTGREAGGAYLWSDYLYDDHGAASLQGLPISSSALTSFLAPPQGVYAYPDGEARGNGADIFRSAVGLDREFSYWRVDWNTLADPALPIAQWAFDTDADAATGGTSWAAGAEVDSPGIERALVVSSRGAWLIDAVSGERVDVAAAGGALDVDPEARSFVVRVPRSLLPVGGSWRVRLGAGLADPDGTGFAPPEVIADLPVAAGDLPGLPRLYNVTFRTVAQEPPVFTGGLTGSLLGLLAEVLRASPLDGVGLDGATRAITGNFWMEDNQADTLVSGDVSKFSRTIDWSSLAERTTTPEPHPTGYSNRWYVTELDLGQGVIGDAAPPGDLRPNYLGRVQPYAVYVPESYRPGEDAPLTWILHSLGVNLNQYGALNPSLLQQACESRGSICATTQGFGPDGWYFDEGEHDFWRVWRELAGSYSLDPERTVISGYSMGGYAAYKLGLAYPDLFAKALSLEGPQTCGIRVIEGLLGVIDLSVPADGLFPGRCGSDGETAPLLGNARWLPYQITQGAIDELVPVTGGLQQVLKLDRLGYRYHFEFYPTEDHVLYALQDRFGSQAAELGNAARERNPGRITYTWYPNLTRADYGIGPTGAYWIRGLAAREVVPGQTASVEARSAAIPDPEVTVVRGGPSLLTTPLPGGAFDLDWQLGAAPEPAPRIELELQGVGALGVDTERAGLSCGTVRVESDGPTTLRLLGLSPGTAVTGPGTGAVRTGPDGSVELSLGTGESTVEVTCPSGAATQQPPLPGAGTSPQRPCAAQGRLRIRLPRPRSLRVARVYVDGRLAEVLRGRRLRAKAELRGVPEGLVKVRVVARTRDGRRVVTSRSYDTCASR